MIAVTATVNTTSRKDIIKKLDMNGCTFIYASPDRPNICYIVKPRTDLSTCTDLADITLVPHPTIRLLSFKLWPYRME